MGTAEDWPTYRHDSARSGVTADELGLPLSECWVFRPRHAPEPAWGEPNPRPVGGWHGLVEHRRVHFDDAFHVAVSGGGVFFGSSATGEVCALDAATGRLRWSAFTDGPVRLAPTVRNGRVYVGSDDGFAYCFRARDGDPVWKLRAAPSERKVLGSGKMISLWPLRTSVLVEGETAYFGAGVFPSEGICVYAVRAEDGELIWCNDTCGAAPRSRLSPQGYLLASKEALFAPTGRVSPAAFDRKSGRLLHQAYIDHRIGGTYAVVAGDHLFTGTKELIAYGLKSPRARLAWFQGRKLVVREGVYYLLTEREMMAIDRNAFPAPSLQRRNLLGRKRGLRNDLRKAERDREKREAAVEASAARLAEVERKVAGLTKVDGARQEEAAAFGTQIQALRNALARLVEQQGTLAGAKRRVDEVKGELKAVEEGLQKVDSTVKDTVKWRLPCDCYDSMIMAGGVILAGGESKVMAVDAKTGEAVWTGRVDGRARGLAAADGRLFVSTDTGAIHCFGPTGSRRIGPVRRRTDPTPYPRDRMTPVFEAAAERIVSVFKSGGGIDRGYCLVMGCGTGRLAYELAKRTGLKIYGVDPDPKKVADARRALEAAGLYGGRVCVERAPLSKVPYSDYFANLIVSESALTSGEPPGDAREIFRMLKPLGGMALIGQPAEARGRAKELTRSALGRWLDAAGVGDWRADSTGGLWARAERGPLKGAGRWIHQHAEPGNTACGDDQIVKCPLGVLWFGDPGPGKMTERHAQAAAPLSLDGRLFIQGENVVMACDAYNGVKLWERDIPGAKRTRSSRECGNLALNRDSLFVAVNDKCLRLDAATGETKGAYGLPPSPDGGPRRWGYVAVASNKGDELLFGTSTKAGRNCDCVFAVDLRSGKHRWVHRGGSISHITIVIGGGRVFFADAVVPPGEQQKVMRERLRERLRDLKELKGRALEEARKRLKAHLDARLDIRLVVALDAGTGAPEWQRAVELTDCRKISRGGGELVCMYRDDVLVFCAASVNGHFWKEFFAGDFAGRTVVALSAGVSGADGGRLLWSKGIGYRHRPLIVGDTLIAEPWAFDLKTGRLKMRKSPLTGEDSPWQFARPGHHCGATSACRSALFFRSGTIAYYDLLGDYGTQHFGSIRPGCWISMIPANGLVLAPEASSGCMCAFPNQCTVVFQPREERENEPWAMYSLFGPGKQHRSWAVRTVARLVESSSAPVRHLALNLGAPGDRKDADGTLWLGYPRPRGALVFQYAMKTRILPGGGYYRQNPLSTVIEGTDKPWVYASGCRGLTHCVLPLVGEKQRPGLYTVRLGFAGPDNDRPGERVFDIKLQGSTMLEDFDAFGRAGGRNRVIVRDFEEIQVDRDLTIELVSKGADSSRHRIPVLNSVEVRRTKSLRVSLRAPSFLLSDVRPEQTREVRVTNHADEPFAGTLRAGSIPGITVEPRSIPVRLEPGAEKAFTLKAAASREAAAGEYGVPLELVGEAGQVESETSAFVNHLGGRREIVLAAVEDAFVKKKNPKRNHGSDQHLWVDGGNKEMGDHDHSVVYLKFRLEVPGRPRSARVRLHVGTWDGAESGNSGVVRLVKGKWREGTLSYENQPELGAELAKIGKVGKGDAVERTLEVPLEGRDEVSIALAPTSCDGGGYCSRETSRPAELIVGFGP